MTGFDELYGDVCGKTDGRMCVDKQTDRQTDRRYIYMCVCACARMCVCVSGCHTRLCVPAVAEMRGREQETALLETDGLPCCGHTHARSRTNSHTLKVTHNSAANERTYQSTTVENRKTHQHASLNRHHGHRLHTTEIKQMRNGQYMRSLPLKFPESAARNFFVRINKGNQPCLTNSLQLYFC